MRIPTELDCDRYCNVDCENEYDYGHPRLVLGERHLCEEVNEYCSCGLESATIVMLVLLAFIVILVILCCFYWIADKCCSTDSNRKLDLSHSCSDPEEQPFTELEDVPSAPLLSHRDEPYRNYDSHAATATPTAPPGRPPSYEDVLKENRALKA